MDQKFIGLALIIIIGSALAGIAKLIQRGKPKLGVILILLLPLKGSSLRLRAPIQTGRK